MRISIPINLPFSALGLKRSADGAVSFDTSVIEQIEQASGLEPGHFMSQPEEVLAELLTTWYAHHRASGGPPDATADELLAEVRAEDALGGGLTHAPGRA